jgi:hypothetical protein
VELLRDTKREPFSRLLLRTLYVISGHTIGNKKFKTERRSERIVRLAKKMAKKDARRENDSDDSDSGFSSDGEGYTTRESFCGIFNMEIIIDSCLQSRQHFRQSLIKKPPDFQSKFFSRPKENIISNFFIHDFP